MKNIAALLFMIVSLTTVNAQDPTLLENQWNLFNVVIMGDDNIPPPFNDDITEIGLLFDMPGSTTPFTTYVCNGLYGQVTYAGNDTFSLTDLNQTLGSCNGNYSDNYEMTYFEFYFDNATSPFTYEITDEGGGGLGLIVTAANGDTAEYGNPILSISEKDLQNISIYPNPVAETLFISSEETLIESILVFTINGKQVLSEAEQLKSIDVSSLKSGLYFVSVSTSEGSSIQKFIKQ